MTDYGFSERRACRLIGVNRSAWQYEPLRGKDDAVRERMRELANERRRFGYRRLAIPLRREGKGMNLKKVYRLYREERLTVQPWPRRAPDAPASRPRACRAPVPAMHDRQPPLSADCREPAGAELRGDRAEPDLTGRHHVHRHRRRLAVSGGRARPGNPQDRRLGHAQSYANRTATRCHDGRAAAASSARPHLPLGSRVAICRRGLCRLPVGDPRLAFDEPHRQLLRQCPDGELLPQAQGRAGSSMPMGNSVGSPTGAVRIHRRLLQPAPDALGSRVSNPRASRAAHERLIPLVRQNGG